MYVCVHRSAYEGLRSVGPFVAERFIKIVKLRNELARLCGYKCYYDMKVCKGGGQGLERTYIMEHAQRSLTQLAFAWRGEADCVRGGVTSRRAERG